MYRSRVVLMMYGVLMGILMTDLATGQDKFHDYYDRGLGFMQKEDWLRAAEEFKACISMEFEDRASKQTYGTKFIEYFPHRELGVAYYQLGDLRMALEELQISIATAPSKRANEFIEKTYKALAHSSTMSSLAYGKTDSLSSEDLHPRNYVALFVRDDRGESALTGHRLTEYLRSESSIRITFPEALLKTAVSPISVDSVSNKIRLLSSYLRFLIGQQEDALKSAGTEDSSRISDKYRKDIDDALVETRYLKRMTRSFEIRVRAVAELPGGHRFPIEIPNYFSYADTSGRAWRIYALTADGQLRDEIVDTEINLATLHLPNGSTVQLDIETRSAGGQWTYTKYFAISSDEWQYEFRPTVAFVKRLQNEKNVQGDIMNKSDFKPAPAVTIQLLHTPHKAASLKKMAQTFAVGVTVLLADYEPKQNVELGIGFGAMLFNSSVGMGLGWNLQSSSKPGFYYISTDILRLIEALQTRY